MCLTLTLEMLQIIHESSLSEKDKENLQSTIRTAGLWTPEQKAMFDQAIQEWDDNHPRVAIIGRNGRLSWEESK